MLNRRPGEPVAKDDFIVSVRSKQLGKHSEQSERNDNDESNQSERLFFDKPDEEINERILLFSYLHRFCSGCSWRH